MSGNVGNLSKETADHIREKLHMIRQALLLPELADVLAFYADPMNWSADGTFLGSDVSGKRCDAGARARAALSKLQEATTKPCKW